MPRTKPKPDRKSRNGSAQSPAAAPARPGEVMTLAEAAAYLRVPEAEVLRLHQEQGLPGRSFAGDWRFLKSAVAGWLGAPAAVDRGKFWQTHFGALQDDPYLDHIVRAAYRQRGRPQDGEP